MARWSEVEAEAPALAAEARALFDRDRHKTIATLRRDGSPRISGIEVVFEEGDLVVGSMWRAVKALDLLRDGRFALHSPSPYEGWRGDAKVAGRMVDVSVPGERSHRFRADITELSVVRLGGDPADHLIVETWVQGRGIARERRD